MSEGEIVTVGKFFPFLKSVFNGKYFPENIRKEENDLQVYITFFTAKIDPNRFTYIGFVRKPKNGENFLMFVASRNRQPEVTVLSTPIPLTNALWAELSPKLERCHSFRARVGKSQVLFVNSLNDHWGIGPILSSVTTSPALVAAVTKLFAEIHIPRVKPKRRRSKNITLHGISAKGDAQLELCNLIVGFCTEAFKDEEDDSKSVISGFKMLLRLSGIQITDALKKIAGSVYDRGVSQRDPAIRPKLVAIKDSIMKIMSPSSQDPSAPSGESRKRKPESVEPVEPVPVHVEPVSNPESAPKPDEPARKKDKKSKKSKKNRESNPEEEDPLAKAIRLFNQ